MQPTLSFHEHVQELRRRLFCIVGALVISGSISYVLRKPIINFIQTPIHSALYFTSPAGSFNFVIKIVTIVAIFLALPVITYNLIRFIEPALPKSIGSKKIYKITGYSLGLALIGAAFGYYIIAPMSLHFFMSYSSASLKPLITANEYLSFILNVIITFALIFQIPLIVMFINFIKPLSPRKLLHYQKYVIVGALIIAAILPFTYDPISQFVLALPIVAMYYLSVGIVALANHKKIAKIKEPLRAVVNSVIETPQVTSEPLNSSLTNKPRTIDGFLGNHKTGQLTGYKRFEALSIEEYRAKNSLRKSGRNSIDGMIYAN